MKKTSLLFGMLLLGGIVIAQNNINEPNPQPTNPAVNTNQEKQGVQDQNTSNNQNNPSSQNDHVTNSPDPNGSNNPGVQNGNTNDNKDIDRRQIDEDNKLREESQNNPPHN